MTASRTIQLKLSSLAPYEVGATLFTALTYPDYLEDDKAMSERHAALCQLWLGTVAQADPEWMFKPQTLKPAYQMTDPDFVERIHKEFTLRLDHRLGAGRMAIPFLQREAGFKPLLPTGVKRLSVNELAAFVAPQLGQSDGSNVKTRVWMPSRPVLHIAAAIEICAREQEPAAPIRTLNVQLMLNPDAVRWVVDRSEAYADALLRIRGFKIRAERLIHLCIS